MTASADSLWASLAPDAAGLVTAVVQHAHTGQVLMVGHMNRDALAATLEARRLTFWSRSRASLWEKGETSGNTLDLVSLRVDCDGDAVLATALPRGPTCHTGATSCFFRSVGGKQPALADPGDDGPAPLPAAVLARVFEVILERKAGQGMTNRDGKSYVRSLLDGGPETLGRKLREEADELARAIAGETDDRVANEAADLIFHALVGLAGRDLDLEAVATVLAARFGTSGVDEKASR